MTASAYTTLPIVKASLGITDTDSDTAITAAINAASRAIDRLTATTFAASAPTPTARIFVPSSSQDVWVDSFTATIGLVVKTGTDGTYTTTVTATDVLPWPYNAPSQGDAYYRLLVPTCVLPMGYARPTVQVTASWGWDSIPDDVAEACRLKAAALFRRKDSPEGIAGTGDFGVVRISKYEDPDVMKLLSPFIPVLVG